MSQHRAESEEVILSPLSSQGVCQVKRLLRSDEDGVQSPLLVVVFHFPSSSPLPAKVYMAARPYDIENQNPRPLTCHHCWRFGHSKSLCSFDARCRKWSKSHDLTAACPFPPKCPSYGGGDHAAGMAICSIFIQRKKIMTIRRIYYLYAETTTLSVKYLNEKPQPLQISPPPLSP